MADPEPVDEPQDALRARDLLPPDPPAPVAEPRRIAERRVVGWGTALRLIRRRARRPAGNSRRFWARMEADDPFLPPPAGARAPEVGHDQLYPSERLTRLPTHAMPQPRPAGPRPASPRPDTAHTPDPRTAPSPAPARPAPPRPAPAQPASSTARPARPAPAPPAAGASQPPPAPSPPRSARPTSGTGRVRIQRATRVPPPSVQAGPTPAEVRAAKKEARPFGGSPPPPPKLRGLDEVLGMLGELKVAEELYEAGITGPTDTDRVDAPRRPRQAPVDPAPAPTPPVDRTPPRPVKPAASSEASPPSAPDAQAGLDDLFGAGGTEDRPRLGRRSRPRGPVVESRED